MDMNNVRRARSGLDVWGWIGALVAAGVLASMPVATQQNSLAGAASAAAPARQVQSAPEIPFPTAKPDPAVVQAAKLESIAALLPRTSGGQLVPVIVGFAAAFVPEGRLRADSLSMQRAAIAIAREDVLSQLLRGSASVIKRFETIPYFAAHVDADALQTLSGLQNVTSIVEDIPLQPSLNDSTVIVQANQVWAAGLAGTGWNVAVLDSGVDKTHEMFAGGKVVSEACYSTTGGGGTSACPGGSNSTAPGSGVNCSLSVSGCDHGTHVAGIAAGNASGLKGVAPGAGVIAIQVFSVFSASSCGGVPCISAWNSDIILGLQRVLALAGGGTVASVNMSLGGGYYTSHEACDAANGATKAAIDNLRSVNIATVIASGNNGYNDRISAPGCISTAVAVGSTTKAGAVSSFSNMAPGMVELLAPGSSILSSVPGNRYASWNGTSMATPHVAGAWALLKAVAALKMNAGSVTTIQSALQSTGKAIVHAGSGGTYREIRVYDAAVQIYSGGGGSVPGAPSGLTASVSGSNITLAWKAPTTGGAPTAYTVEAGSSPGLANLANFSTGNTATTFPAGGVGDGTYYVRVRATNSAGASGPSNEAIMIVGCTSAPGVPSGLTTTQNSGGNVAFSWSAATGGPTTYFLEAGSAPGLANLANSDLGGTGTTFATSGVGAGTYYVRVRAANACGKSGASNEITLVVR